MQYYKNNRADFKYLILKKLVEIFGLEKAERIFKVFDCKSLK